VSVARGYQTIKNWHQPRKGSPTATNGDKGKPPRKDMKKKRRLDATHELNSRLHEGVRSVWGAAEKKTPFNSAFSAIRKRDELWQGKSGYKNPIVTRPTKVKGEDATLASSRLGSPITNTKRKLPESTAQSPQKQIHDNPAAISPNMARQTIYS